MQAVCVVDKIRVVQLDPARNCISAKARFFLTIAVASNFSSTNQGMFQRVNARTRRKCNRHTVLALPLPSINRTFSAKIEVRQNQAAPNRTKNTRGGYYAPHLTAKGTKLNFYAATQRGHQLTFSGVTRTITSLEPSASPSTFSPRILRYTLAVSLLSIPADSMAADPGTKSFRYRI